MPRSFQNSTSAFSSGLAYVEANGKVIMRGDNTTWLASGVKRNRQVIFSDPGPLLISFSVCEYLVGHSITQDFLSSMRIRFHGAVVRNETWFIPNIFILIRINARCVARLVDPRRR